MRLSHRSEFSLAGEVVNLAARLAAIAEENGKVVLCDENTLKTLTGEVGGVHDALDPPPQGKGQLRRASDVTAPASLPPPLALVVRAYLRAGARSHRARSMAIAD